MNPELSGLALRDDVVTPSLPREVVMAMRPEHSRPAEGMARAMFDEGYFCVPRAIEEAAE